MPAIPLAPPAAEPITLAEAKAYLRLEHGAEDALIGALIASARVHVESATRQALITQSWRLALGHWPARGVIRVPRSPVQAILAVRVFSAEGVATSLGTGVLALTPGEVPAALHVVGFPPAPERMGNGIEIDLRLGYGDAGSAVPAPLRQAIRMLIAHWYERRAFGEGARERGWPAELRAVLAPYLGVAL